LAEENFKISNEFSMNPLSWVWTQQFKIIIKIKPESQNESKIKIQI
jgi:hypothetical protein